MPPKKDPWISLYRKALDLSGSVPWDSLPDHLLFGIRARTDGGEHFAAVMENEGARRTVSFFTGREGLRCYLRSLSYEIEDEENVHYGMLNDIMMAPQLQLVFANAEDAMPEEVRRWSGSGAPSSGIIPLFRRCDPSFVPEPITQQDLPVMTELVDLCHAYLGGRWGEVRGANLESSPEDPDFEGQVPTLVPKGDGHELVDVPFRLSRFSSLRLVSRWDDADKLRKLPRATEPYEIDLCITTIPVAPEGRRARYAFALMIVGEKTGTVHGMELVEAEPDLASMWSGVCQKTSRLLERHGHIPSQIFIRNELIEAALSPMTDELEIEIQYDTELPALDDALDDMTEMMDKKDS